MSIHRPDPRDVARGLGVLPALQALEAEGLALVWREELESLQGDAREARRLHAELDDLREEIARTYQGESLR